MAKGQHDLGLLGYTLRRGRHMTDEVNAGGDTELRRQARSLSKGQRQEIVASWPETHLHKQLKELLKAMQPDYTIALTHGSTELGKDLVMVKRDLLTSDVIGVVVKCGDITGHTSGDVDKLKARVKDVFSSKEEKRIAEISSQIEQAFTHPAEMPTIFHNLPVNKVIVILAGQLSNRARVRLQAELKAGVVYDLEWLVENFTEHYPQAFYDGKAIDFLQLKIQELETRNWLVKSHKNLTEYYVEPLVSTAYQPKALDSESLIKMLERRPMPFSSLLSMIDKKGRFILAGDPGTGKSAALAMLAIQILRNAYLEASRTGHASRLIRIPVFLTANDLLKAKDAQGVLDMYCTQNEIRERFSPHALLVDGLDEVASTDREKALTIAEEYARTLDCALVVTSRKIDAINVTSSKLEKFEMLPFEVGQARQMFERLLGDTEKISALQDSLERIKYQIPITPLSIVLLMKLVQEHDEIPASVTELYDRYVDAVLGRDDKEKGISVLFDYFIKKGFLSNLAYTEFMAKDRLYIPRTDFDEFVSSYGTRYGWRADGVSEFLADIERSGVLDIKEIVEFRHRSFLDYFAAFYVFNKQDEFDDLSDFLVRAYYGDLWEDVTFFYVGLKREISEKMLGRIFDHDGQGLTVHGQKFLVGRLLQAGWFSPTDVKSYGIERAFEYAQPMKAGFLDLTEKYRLQVPKIYADFFLLIMTDFSFRSGFLKKELQSFYRRLSDDGSERSILLRVPLLWALKPFVESTEFKQLASECVKSVEGSSATSEERAASLVLLRAITQDDRGIKKTITKKLNELSKHSPGVFSNLLPTKKPGFRK